MTTTDRPVLIAYDGSDDARRAIDTAGALVAGRPAYVLYVREPIESVAAHLAGHPALGAVRVLAGEDQDAAERTAAEGAAHANAAGVAAKARVASAGDAIADTIIDVADALEASVIGLGSRGRRRLKSALLGSVSTHVIHHARRPALVLPSPSLATARGRVREAVATAEPAIAG